MFRRQKIRDLERLVRVRTAERDEAREDARSWAAAASTSSRLLFERDQQDQEAAVQQRLDRALRACARYRAQQDQQARVMHRLSNTLLDAVGNKGEHLIPAEREILGLAGTEVSA